MDEFLDLGWRAIRELVDLQKSLIGALELTMQIVLATRNQHKKQELSPCCVVLTSRFAPLMISSGSGGCRKTVNLRS